LAGRGRVHSPPCVLAAAVAATVVVGAVLAICGRIRGLLRRIWRLAPQSRPGHGRRGGAPCGGPTPTAGHRRGGSKLSMVESHEVCCGSGEGCGASGAARGGRDGGPFRDLVVRFWHRGRRLASLWPSWTCLLLAHLGVHFGTPSAWSPRRQPEFAARRPGSPLARWRPPPPTHGVD